MIKKIITSEKIPIKLWLDEIEEAALTQTKNLANYPFAIHHIAIMPDAHVGYGMPIGAILATQKVVIPHAVGVDIGCGMLALRTSLTKIKTQKLKKIMQEIRRTIPLGFDRHKTPQDEALMPKAKGNLEIVMKEYPKALKQIGTLGGGNHFIEIQQGNDSYIWLMIHSGSRNLGFQVANHYNNLAIALNEKAKIKIARDWCLNYLELESQEGQMYLDEMQFCVEFALANRQLMMERIKTAIQKIIDSNVKFSEMINIAHNYASFEEHFGQKLLIHRKGATPAFKGKWGIIPGSQGSKSYIVTGLGNPESFCSCSHGSGRLMGRNQARKSLSLENEKAKLDKLGILHSIRGIHDLDEASGAYKDIQMVIDNQLDLVKIEVELSPLAVIKG